VRLHQHWPRVRQMSSPRAWLSTVAMNLARSWWRRRAAQRRAQSRLCVLTETEMSGEPSDVLAVRAAVVSLPHRQRAALVLRFYAGLSVTETARHLHCAEGTVKSLTHRAIAALRAQFDVDVDFDIAFDAPAHPSIETKEAPRAWFLA
jgi:RNA polymerase sigma factor (sigma-70 family)